MKCGSGVAQGEEEQKRATGQAETEREGIKEEMQTEECMPEGSYETHGTAFGSTTRQTMVKKE